MFEHNRAGWLMATTALVFAATATAAIVSAQAGGARRTVWDGVYTEAQASRASGTFSQACAECHTLGSQGEGPLSGPKFFEGYSQKTVGDLLTFVKTYMPDGAAGSLQPSAYTELVALILKSNGFPPGAADLAPESAANVQITAKDGAGGSSELPANALVRIVGCLAKSGNDWVLTRATAPVRAERPGVDPGDAGRPLGTRTTTLKFVLTRLDSFVGQRMSVSGMLIGDGGVDGVNVTTVNRVAETCP